ncbi:MAG: pitrilysin family protein [Bryocella sp.]
MKTTITRKISLATVLIAAASFSVSLATAQSAAIPQSYKQVPIPALHKFEPPQPVHVTLPNGVQLFLQEDHELPFIDGFIRIRGGARDEPADKVGLVSLYGRSWRTSGTATHPGDKLDDELAAKAAAIETSGSQASTSIQWSGFASDFDSIFATAVDLLEHPVFSEAKLDLAKRSMSSSILRRNDDASGIADREAIQIAYGKTNPYGRQAQLATVSAVTLADLNAWHAKTVDGAGLIVGVIGDFDTHAMEAKLRAAFESLPRGTAMVEPAVTFAEPIPGIYYVNKSDVDQSNIIMVGLGTEQRNPDFYALSVMNTIFSGGFSSRVVQNVRTKLGLAYDVGGRFGAAYDHPGIFAVELGTRSASTVAATKATLAEVTRLRTDPPTPEEMRIAKDQLLNSFIFRYDTPEKILAEQVTLAVYGYPADFLERYRVGVEKVTSADVSRVAQKYIQPSKLAIVVVGNMGEIQPPLSDLGKTTQLDITIPGAPAAQ